MEFDLGEATNPSCEALQLSITTHYGIVDPSMHNKATNYVRFIKFINETFVQIIVDVSIMKDYFLSYL